MVVRMGLSLVFPNFIGAATEGVIAEEARVLLGTESPREAIEDRDKEDEGVDLAFALALGAPGRDE